MKRAVPAGRTTSTEGKQGGGSARGASAAPWSTLQRSLGNRAVGRLIAAQGVEGAGEPLPFLARIQDSFGDAHELAGVRTRTGGAAAEANAALGARGFTLGESIAFQRAPDLRLAAHEAAHVVQQRAGVRAPAPGDAHERAADAIAERVLAGRSAADLLPAPRAGGASAVVQLQPEPGIRSPVNYDDPIEGVIPGDRGQIDAALATVDVAAIWDADAELQAFAREYAERWAGKTASERAGKDYKKALDAAKAQVAARIQELRAASKKAVPRAEQNRLQAEAARAVPRVHAGDVEGTIADEMMGWYRDTFIFRAGNIINQRESGGASPGMRKKLALAEFWTTHKKVKGKGKNKDKVIAVAVPYTPELEERMIDRRHDYQDALAAQIELAKVSFRTLVRNHYRFKYEAQNAKPMAKGFARPKAGLEPTIEARHTGGLMSVDKDKKGDQPVALSVMLWLSRLRATSPVRFRASTYWGHSWQEYSIDMFPYLSTTEDGYYDPDGMVEFFIAADAAARALKYEWRALYTDLDVAKRVNERLGVKRVVFQWHHGPAPYVLHAHFDIQPTVFPQILEEGGQSHAERPGAQVCYPDDFPRLDWR